MENDGAKKVSWGQNWIHKKGLKSSKFIFSSKEFSYLTSL